MSLKEEIDRKFGLSSKIRLGSPGALDVIADGQLVFSAKASKRMPTTNEILDALALRQSGA